MVLKIGRDSLKKHPVALKKLIAFDRSGSTSSRHSGTMNSRELAADVPLATQESDEDEFEVDTW